MARKTLRSRTRAAATPATVLDARSLVLASLGAVLRGRREVIRLAGEAAAVPVRLRAGAEAAATAARQEAAKLAREADRAIAGAANTLNPLLARVGLPALRVAKGAKKAPTRAKGRRAPAVQRKSSRAAATRKRA